MAGNGAGGDAGAPATAGGSAGLGAGGVSNTGVLEGGGCSCRTAPGNTGALGGLALGALGLGLLLGRRRNTR
jgi:MYXO-CTERM domain-containing protein